MPLSHHPHQPPHPFAVLAVAIVLAGCLDGAPAPGSTDGDPQRWLVPSQQWARYEVAWDDKVQGHMHLNVTVGAQLEARVILEVRGDREEARALYDLKTGAMRALVVTARETEADIHGMDAFWPQDEEALVPVADPELSIADLAPVGAYWLAQGWNPRGVATEHASSDGDGWLWAGTVLCRSLCLAAEGAVESYRIQVEGGPGILANAVSVTSWPTNTTVTLSRVDGGASAALAEIQPGPGSAANLPSDPCPVVPCDAPELGLHPTSAWKALATHPAWLAWTTTHPGWRLVSFADGTSTDPTGVRHETWRFLVGVPGDEVTRFDLRSATTGPGPAAPLLTGVQPAGGPWNPAWDDLSQPTRWAPLGAMVAAAEARVPRDPATALEVAGIFVGPGLSPDPGRRVLTTLAYGTPCGAQAVINGYNGTGLPANALFSSLEDGCVVIP